jgi:hypothetical protein
MRKYRELPSPSELKLDEKPFPNAPPPFAIRMAIGLRRFLLGLADKLSPAEVAMFELTTGVANTALVGAIARYDIADLLEERGALDASEIASARGLDEDAVHRTMRAAANMGIFEMSSDGRFANTRLSRTLCSGRLLRTREWALYFASKSNCAAWHDYARTLETGESAFGRVHGMNVWDWFDAHPEEREMFAHCMMGLTTMDAPAIASLYPFSEVKRLCDVGGGRGTLLSEILVRHPHIHGVLCDGAGVIESAKPLLEARGVASRVTLSPGSFFEEVPSGCDAYLTKNILHDWNDETSKKILSVIRKAMKPGQRMLLCESLVEKNSREIIGTRADLQMMIACEDGRERSRDELFGLLEATGFRRGRVFPFPTVSVVEGEAV